MMKSEYIDHMGTDLTVVNAARVSFDKESDWATDDDYQHLSEKDAKLISYLAKHNHWTPFGHPQIILRETVPIFVARQRFKHTVGFVYNEVSRRYVDDDPEFYTPEVWRARAENVKQGSSDKEIIYLADLDNDYIGNEKETIRNHYAIFLEQAKDLYDMMIYYGVAPEQARMVLPQSMYTSYYVTGSLAAWARAYKLRSDSHAQKEIQDLAKQWNEIIEPLFPVSWKALTTNV